MPNFPEVNFIHAEVEIPVASNLRPLCDKTFVASDQWSISVSSDIDVFYFYLRSEMKKNLIFETGSEVFNI